MIYLDNNSTTPLDPRVFEEMRPYFLEIYSNSSSTHSFGRKAKTAVNKARSRIANSIGSNTNEIIFTSGSTEAINLALKGLALNSNQKRHIISVQSEHRAVLDTLKYLEGIGFEISYLPVDRDGKVCLEDLKKTIRPDTLLICIMYANNETGLIQPIKAIGKIARKSGVLFMTDATQAVGKIPLDVDDLEVDLMAFSAHKFYGPKGVGSLFVRKDGMNNISLLPLLHGGGHEQFLRSGTLNVPGIVGFGKALEIALIEMEEDIYRIGELRNYLEDRLLQSFSGSRVNGTRESRMFNVSNIFFPGLDANLLIGSIKDIAFSNGSACTSAIIEPSHVLTSMGLSDKEAFASIRFSLGRFTQEQEIEKALEILENIIPKMISKY